ncbi:MULTISPECIES: phosphoribosyl-ATP diphosphatase [unclassified Adlercreutzia]|uniref:phosphoribosyl-ATP diphosphatase n=1 Tax=unclassified Adlercreutzia TaxID=2636013 RepID=UPI0013ED3063|nr:MULTISPECIES: phosphoribosyl-ATP diphosphatase [unclassified Adlercreutzia]
MTLKTYVPEGETPQACQIGASLEVLANTISARRSAGEESYTYRLLTGDIDMVLKKLMEEAGEVALAAKDVNVQVVGACDSSAYDAAIDHLRYEAGDVVYHLLVVLERFGISIDEFAAEMNSRMRDDEISLHEGMVRLQPQHVNRGK